MDLDGIKEWIIVLSASVTMLSVATGIWLSLREYRLKLQAEGRLERASEIEAEIRLHTLFTQLMRTANGRSGYQLSEKAIEFLLAHFHSEGGKLDIVAVNRALEDLSIIRFPVGSAEQDSSVAAISSLTIRHPVLREAGMRALQALVHPATSPVAQNYYEKTISALKAEGVNVEELMSNR